MGNQMWRSLPQLIVDCAENTLSKGFCGEKGIQTLLQQIVIVGGAADFPGMRPRVEFEVRELLRDSASVRLRGALASTDDAYVLNPPVGNAGPLVTPRFVPLFGGCARAASSLHLDEALQNLPFMADDDSSIPQHAGISHFMRLQLLRNIRAGPRAFRTGGGGGEDDHIWQLFDMANDVWSDSSDDDEYDVGENESESCLEESPRETSAEQDLDLELENRQSASTAAASNEYEVAGSRRRRRRGFRQRNAQGNNVGKGKGRARSQGKSQGKGKRQRVWRPVAQPG